MAGLCCCQIKRKLPRCAYKALYTPPILQSRPALAGPRIAFYKASGEGQLDYRSPVSGLRWGGTTRLRWGAFGAGEDYPSPS